eukprot:TRINITY_DN1714_c0_g1_i1.p1 TRINITY_DN1714_c0_g1~~TRINITY_DN1714_c0_g1_i1.p1  ORF type:complete len:508 (-),score=120.37 TRINITY_DN1714_c0_g1_i1:440-1963(-)
MHSAKGSLPSLPLKRTVPTSFVPILDVSQTARVLKPSRGSQLLPIQPHSSRNHKINPIKSEKIFSHRKQREASKPKPTRPTEKPHKLTPAQCLRHHMKSLSEYEQGEILEHKEIFFLGNPKKKIRGISRSKHNYGFDDEKGDYNVVMHDHLGYRYEVLDALGKGSFGQVLKCYDHKNSEIVAVKIIRNRKRFHHQALVEVKILEHIRDNDPEDQTNIYKIIDSFYFRSHLCISFKLYSMNLFEFMKNNNFQGVSLNLIRRFAVQMLTSLRFLAKQKIIHCDLKPENVLLRQQNKSGIRVIDFGSSCFQSERIYTYIQSRFYRAPEVILGLPYGLPIDIWSFGCILAELFTGYPLFPGENETEQLLCVMEIMNLPPKHLIQQASRRRQFFDSNGSPRIVPNSRGRKRLPGTKDLQMVLRCSDSNFIDFLQGCLHWEPSKRMTPLEALQHPWIMEANVVLRSLKPAVTHSSTYKSNKKKRGSSFDSHSSNKKSLPPISDKFKISSQKLE